VPELPNIWRKNTNTHKTAVKTATFSHRYQHCTKVLVKLKEDLLSNDATP
jgi:hypothetical protein